MLNIWPVPMTQRSHLFPFRTQKLSSVVPKILGWRRPGKIGRRRLFSSLYFQHGPLVKRSRRRPLTPQTGVRFSHGSPRRNGLHSIQKAQPNGWAFLIPFRHSSLTPQNFARQTFAWTPLPGQTGTPAEWTSFHSKSRPFGWAFLMPFRQSSLSPQNFARQTFAGVPLLERLETHKFLLSSLA